MFNTQPQAAPSAAPAAAPAAPAAPAGRPSIMDTFTGAHTAQPGTLPVPGQQVWNPQPQPQPAPQNAGQPQGYPQPQPQPQNQFSAPQGGQPQGTNQVQPWGTPPANNQVQQPAPLDILNSFVQTNTNAPAPHAQGSAQPQHQPQGQPQQVAALDSPLFSITREQLQQAMATQQFVGNIDQALYQRALGGDQQAFQQVLNSVAQQQMVMVMGIVQNMIERGVSTYNARLQHHLPNTLSNFTMTSAVQQANPMFSHPALQGVVAAATQLVDQQFKHLPPHLKAQKVQEYFGAMVAAMQPQQQQNTNGQAPNGQTDPYNGTPVGGGASMQPTNWANFFTPS